MSDPDELAERIRAAIKTMKHIHGEEGGKTWAEALAIDGIMALLPENTVDWEGPGPWPDRIDDALTFLEQHLTKITNQKNPKRP